MLKRIVHGTASLGASSHLAKTRGVKWQFHSIVGGGWFTSGSPVVLSGGIHTCCIVGNPPSRTSQAQTRRRAQSALCHFVEHQVTNRCARRRIPKLEQAAPLHFSSPLAVLLWL